MNNILKNKIVHVVPTSIRDNIARTVVALMRDLPDFNHTIVDLHAGKAGISKAYLEACKSTIAASDQFVGLSDKQINQSDAACVISYMEGIDSKSVLNRFVATGDSKFIYYYDIAKTPMIEFEKYKLLIPSNEVFTVDAYLESYISSKANYTKLLDVLNRIDDRLSSTDYKIRVLLSNSFNNSECLKSIIELDETSNNISVCILPYISLYDMNVQPNTNIRLALLDDKMDSSISYLSLTAVANRKRVITTNSDVKELQVFDNIKSSSAITDTIIDSLKKFYNKTDTDIDETNKLLNDRYDALMMHGVSSNEVIYKLIKKIYE